jgi:hypothetical protein
MFPAPVAPLTEKYQGEQALHCALHVRYLCGGFDGSL